MIAVPEPGTLSLLGLAGITWLVRRKLRRPLVWARRISSHGFARLARLAGAKQKDSRQARALLAGLC